MNNPRPGPLSRVRTRLGRWWRQPYDLSHTVRPDILLRLREHLEGFAEPGQQGSHRITQLENLKETWEVSSNLGLWVHLSQPGTLLRWRKPWFHGLLQTAYGTVRDACHSPICCLAPIWAWTPGCLRKKRVGVQKSCGPFWCPHLSLSQYGKDVKPEMVKN